jgi:hypothetical protein
MHFSVSYNMDKQKILDALSQAQTVTGAAAIVGCHYMKLRYWMQKHSIPPPKTYTPTNCKVKYCPRCKIEKNKKEFYPCRNTLSAYCKDCMYIVNLESQKAYKAECVTYKGGQCVKCGFSRSMAALEFHHRDPNKKDFGIATKRRHILSEETKKELDKCDLLCANCHRETHEIIALSFRDS